MHNATTDNVWGELKKSELQKKRNELYQFGDMMIS